MESVILHQPGDSAPDGDPLEVNPAMVGAIERHPQNPNKSILNIFGIRYQVRGNRETISQKLGWSKLAPARPVPAEPPKPAAKPRPMPPAASPGDEEL